jgi:hypothetical protein
VHCSERIEQTAAAEPTGVMQMSQSGVMRGQARDSRTPGAPAVVVALSGHISAAIATEGMIISR